MERVAFERLLKEIWDGYFAFVQASLDSGQLRTPAKFYFPSGLIVTRTAHHLIAELVGAQPRATPLKLRRHREESTHRYFGQFELDGPGKAIFKFTGRGHSGAADLCFLVRPDAEILAKRFRFDTLWQSRIHYMGVEANVCFEIGPEAGLTIERCLLVNRKDDLFRIKWVLHALVVPRDSSERVVQSRLMDAFQVPHLPPKGVHIAPPGMDEHYAVAGQFASQFLLPGFSEPNIEQFLREHPRFLERALNATEILHQREFDWMEGNPDPEERSIKPDLLIRRGEYFDIADLKTALLDKESITRGPHRRRAFVEAVRDGLEQLANYREYFGFAKNAEHALQSQGVRVNAPQLVLIVGSLENVDPAEVREAARSRDSSISIIDYDSLNALYLNSVRKGV